MSSANRMSRPSRASDEPSSSDTRGQRDEEQKQRLLTQPHPSGATGVPESIVIKDEELFFLCDRDGSVPLEEGHGLGLYFHDCRYLSGYELLICGARPEPLAASDSDGFRSVFQLCNPRIEDSGLELSRQKVGLRWRHVLDVEKQALRDELTIENYDTKPHDIRLEVGVASDFRDVFVIRGLTDERPGRMKPACWQDDDLVLAYEGGDGIVRELCFSASEPMSWREDRRFRFERRLESHECWQIVMSLAVSERKPSEPALHVRASQDELEQAERSHVFHRSAENWMKGFAAVESESLWVNRAMDRSLRDLRALRTSIDGDAYFAAGVPWFTTLFGRDSLICALQTLAYRRETAAETLRLLAKYQGKTRDSWLEEEPGKILHELRFGELARMGAIPYTPWYGTVDATPLFVILLGEYSRWAGTMDLFEELSGAVEAALEWMADQSARGIGGFLQYDSVSGERLVNQGWKDSGTAIVDSSGRTAEPPIALVEVQGYAYLALLRAADLYDRSGNHGRAESLRREAADLRERFNRDFWIEDKKFYALALQKGGRPADVVSSNPGHALWCGIVPPERHADVVERLMAEDMYSGWGIRTLASSERAYNPIGYHLGTVWPHDNSLIAAGFHACGHVAPACRILVDLLMASSHFDEHRLPETFAGYSRSDLDRPVHYPVACKPQAWACGAIPYLVQTLAGLQPDGFERRLRLVRPCLPEFLAWLRLRRLRVADAELDLLLERSPSGETTFKVERLDGDLEVTCEPG